MAVVQALLEPTDEDSMVLIHQWVQFLEANGKSVHTLRTYTPPVLRFLSSKPKRIRDYNETDVIEFLATLGKTSAARMVYSRALHSFFGWAAARDHIKKDPTLHLRPPKPHQRPAKCFSPEEVSALVLAGHARDPRRGAAILLCYGLGARRTELCALRPEDVDLENGYVDFVETKGDRPRRVELSRVARQALEDLRPWGETIIGVTSVQFAVWVRQAATDCDFPKNRRNAHMLRASYITHLVSRGAPIHVVKELAGHSNVAITNHYLVVMDGQRRSAVDLL